MRLKMLNVTPAHYSEFKDEKFNKFWQVSSSGKKISIHYGKISLIGQALIIQIF
jgi:predicted DNA-binding WGR domain protein